MDESTELLPGLARGDLVRSAAAAEADSLIVEQLTVGPLADLSLSIAAGEIVCLSGSSGAGKTRLLRAIADLDEHGGEVRLGAQSQSRLPAHRWRAQVMLVAAESQWWADGVAEHFPGGRVEHLAELGLPEEAAGWQVARLSSGEKQRLALLRALARAPRALLLDEPTANLDAGTTGRVERWLQARIARDRLPVLWVAHDPAQIERVAHRHLRLEGGRFTGGMP